jgi:molecular chaperone DnaK (HSP70)
MLFQIEEPDGSPFGEPEGPGVAIGVDLAGPRAMVAVAVGGNAETLPARDGTPGPETSALRGADGQFEPEAVAAALLALRGRAERALGRPVTHAVVAVGAPLDAGGRAVIATAAAASGLQVTRILSIAEAAALGGGTADAVVHRAAIAAEDDANLAARS